MLPLRKRSVVQIDHKILDLSIYRFIDDREMFVVKCVVRSIQCRGVLLVRGFRMENHPQRNHPQIQTASVSAASSATTFSSGENKLSRSQMQSIARWTLGPGPIKPPVLILPTAPAEKVSPPPPRLRSGGLLIPPEPAHARKTTKA